MKPFKKTVLALAFLSAVIAATPVAAWAQTQLAEADPGSKEFQLIPCDGVKKQKLDAQGQGVYTDTKDAKGNTVKKAVYVEGSQECDWKQLMALFNRILNFLLYLSIPLVLGMIMYTAFTYLTANGDTSKIAKAKSMFIPVAIGIFWVLAGFIVVKTVLQNFLTDNVGSETKDTFINRFLGN